MVNLDVFYPLYNQMLEEACEHRPAAAHQHMLAIVGLVTSRQDIIDILNEIADVNGDFVDVTLFTDDALDYVDILRENLELYLSFMQTGKSTKARGMINPFGNPPGSPGGNKKVPPPAVPLNGIPVPVFAPVPAGIPKVIPPKHQAPPKLPKKVIPIKMPTKMQPKNLFG